MSKVFDDFPKRWWTRNGTDAEFDKLSEWWREHEDQLLIEMPELKDDKPAYVRHMIAALGFEGELDDVLSLSALDAKQAAAIEIADKLGYRRTLEVPEGKEYEWFRKSIEAGRRRRQAKLDDFERMIKG